MMTPDGDEKRVNWDTAKTCLAQLHHLAPNILRQGVLIGGIACWFYRNLLSKAKDPDFGVPILTAAQERLWLSKDIDFTNFFAQDAREMLPEHLAKDEHGHLRLLVGGIPIGFAQVGVTFDPDSAWVESWIGTFTWDGNEVQFRILDPVSLYLEKQALSQKRGAPADSLHLAVMAEFLRYETLRQIETLVSAKVLEDRALPVKFLFAIRDRAPEICRDGRMQRRLFQQTSTAALLPPSERKLVADITESAQS